MPKLASSTPPTGIKFPSAVSTWAWPTKSQGKPVSTQTRSHSNSPHTKMNKAASNKFPRLKVGVSTHVHPPLQQGKNGQARNEQGDEKNTQRHRCPAVQTHADVHPGNAHAVFADPVGKAQQGRPPGSVIKQPKPAADGENAERPPIKRGQR